MMRFKAVLFSKTVLQVVLFLLFLNFFGITFFDQYQRKETIIVKSEVDTNGIEAPAVTIQASRNNFGWKSVDNSPEWYNFDLQEHCDRINKTLDKCIAGDSTKLDDFLLDIKIGQNFNSSSPLLLNRTNSFQFWEEDMTDTAFGKFYTFKPPRHISLDRVLPTRSWMMPVECELPAKNYTATILTFEQNPPERIFLCTLSTYSQEDFALKSKLRPCNFLLHRFRYFFSHFSKFECFQQLFGMKSHCVPWI